MIGGRSAVLVEVPAAEPVIGRWRLAHDPVAPGVPAHVTVLFPFRPPDEIDEDALRSIAAIAAATPTFGFELTSVAQFNGQFGGVIWLRPEPERPFRELTGALWEAFPDCPPYEGRHDDPQPHVTVAHCADPDAQAELCRAIEADVARHLPVQATATALTVMSSDPDETEWTTLARFPLGVRPPTGRPDTG